MKEIPEIESPLVLNVLNIIIVIFAFSFGLPANAQEAKYILISDTVGNSETEAEQYYIKSYTLKTDELYKKKYIVNTYNIIFDKPDHRYNRIALLTVLPDVITGELWFPIDSAIVFAGRKQIESLSYLAFPNMGYYEGMTNMQRKFYNSYFVVVRKNGQYYSSKNCLL